MRFIIMMLVAFPVAAEQVTIQWTPPDARVDGTPLAVEEIDGYELYVDDVLVNNAIPGLETSIIVDVSAGERCFKMLTRDTEGRSGPFSGVTCKGVKAAPGAPVIITIDYVNSR